MAPGRSRAGEPEWVMGRVGPRSLGRACPESGAGRTESDHTEIHLIAQYVFNRRDL
jgi:hypothetical protein